MRRRVFLFFPSVEKTSCSALPFLSSPSSYPLPLLLLLCPSPAGRAEPGGVFFSRREPFSPGGIYCSSQELEQEPGSEWVPEPGSAAGWTSLTSRVPPTSPSTSWISGSSC